MGAGMAGGIASAASAAGDETRGWMEMGQRLYKEGQEKGKSLRTRRLYPAPKLKAFRDYVLRILALNADKPPVSALDYFRSGGTARFNLDTRMTPDEARTLGLAGRGGSEIPYYDKQESSLTNEQRRFIARLKKRKKRKARDV